MCGEKPCLLTLMSTTPGSPPHVRGKAFVEQAATESRGITPACAGKSKDDQYGMTKNRDHPRMCGEKFLHVSSALWNAGSPPHVRGKAVSAARPRLWCRITPACAGKRSQAAHGGRSCWDHPRMCGEKP